MFNKEKEKTRLSPPLCFYPRNYPKASPGFVSTPNSGPIFAPAFNKVQKKPNWAFKKKADR